MLIDLSQVSTREALHEVLAAAFGFPDLRLPEELVIKGLDHLEAVLPHEATLFLEALGDYNSEPEVRRCAVSVTEDYRCAMFYVLFEAVPTADAEFGDAKGAMVCCWVKTDSAREAHRVARSHIEESGWMIVKQEEICPAVRDDYGDDTTGLPYYEQACVDGTVFVYHTWSTDEDGR